MANNITRKDLISDDALNVGKDIAKSLDPAIIASEKWLEIIKQSALAYKQIGEQFKASGNSQQFVTTKQKEVQLSEQTTIALKEQDRAEKALITTKARLAQSTEGTNRALVKERTALQASNKLVKQQAREQLGLIGAYEKLNSKRTQAQKRLADLLAAEKVNVTQVKKAQIEYTRLNNRILAVDRSTNNYTKNIGNYKSAIGGLTGSFRSLVSALGLASGVFAFVQVMRNGIKTVREFGKSNATLAGILQVEKEEMQGLREESQRLGAETVKTANEVTQLQIAYARLGFSQNEIIDLTEATIQGSIAMNAELSKTANLTGAVVNTFDDFSSTDAPEILDILALATAKSALNFEKLETGIPIVAGAANAAGIPFTKLVALMGKLSDSGIDVSSSSTALRNIFIESAKQGLNYSQIIEEIKNSQDKLTSANDQFGKRAAVSATVLAANIEATGELDEALKNAAGTAESMANKELDTLDGSLQLIKSAWQGIILDTNDANSISNTLKDTIKFLADNLKTLFSVIGTVLKVFVAYKALVIGIGLAKKALTAYTVAYRIAVVALDRGLLRAIKSMRLFKAAMSTTLIGAAVVAITALVYAFAKLNVPLAESVKLTNESTEAYLKSREAHAEQSKEVEKLSSRYEELTGKNKLNTEEQKELDRIIKLLAKDFPNAVTEVNKYGDAIAISTTKVKALNDENKRSLFGAQREKTLLKENEDQLKRLETQQRQYNNVKQQERAFYVEGVGFVANYNGVLKQTNTIQARSGTIQQEGNALTSIQLDLVSEAIKKNEEEIAKKKEFISAIEKEIIERGNLETSSSNNAKSTNENIAANEEELKTLTSLKAELKKLKEERELINLSDKDSLAINEEKIKAINKEIEAVKISYKAAGKSTKDKKALEAKQKQDAFNLAQFMIKESITQFSEIAANEEESLTIRLEALKDKASEELKLATLIKDFKISKVKEGSDEELLILSEYEKQKSKINSDKNNGQESTKLAFIAKQFEAEKKKIEEIKKLKTAALNEAIIAENEAFQKTGRTLEDVEKHEKAIADIKKKFALEAANDQIKAVEKVLNSEQLSKEQIAFFSDQLKNLKILHSKIATDAIIEDIEAQAVEEEKIAEFKAKLITDASNNIAKALEIDSANLDVFITGIVEGFGEGLEGVLAGMSATAAVAGDIMNSVFAQNIENLEYQLEESENYYNSQFELASGDARKQDLIRISQEKKRLELEKKIKKEKIKQAKANKAAAIIQASINTALAITSALTFAPPASFVMAALAAALGIAQVAIIASKPIPKYAKGTDYHRGGLAEVAEERPEVITEPNKAPYIVKKRSILDLPKGTKVTKSVEEYNRLFAASMLSSVDAENNKLNSFHAEQSFNIHNKELLNEMRLNTRAIESIKMNVNVKQPAPVDFEHELFKLKNTNWD